MKSFSRIVSWVLGITLISGFLISGIGSFAHAAVPSPSVAAQFRVSQSITSYDPGTQTLVISGTVTAVRNGAYTIKYQYAADRTLLNQSSTPTVLAFARGYMDAGTTESFDNITLPRVAPGTLYVQAINDSDNSKTAVTTLTVPGVTPAPTPARLSIPVTPTNITTTGSAISLHTQGSVSTAGPVTYTVYSGASTTSLDNHQTFTVPSAAVNTLFPVEYTRSGLQPGTDYWIQITDDIAHVTVQPAFKVTTTGSSVITPTTPSTPGTPLGGDSPAGSDNGGQGGIFSYKYPTNLGQPNGDGSNINGSDGPLVPCTSDTFDTRCRFNDLMLLIGNIIDYALLLILPIIAIMAVVTGAQMMIYKKAPDNPLKLENLKARFGKILVGAAVILLAWTLIATLLGAVLGDEARRYILLDLPSLSQ